MPYHPPGANDPEYLMGLDLATEDYEDQDIEVDVEDLARQYRASDRQMKTAAKLAEGAVTEYMAKAERQGDLERRFRKQISDRRAEGTHEAWSPAKVSPAALEAFRTGYVIGLFQHVMGALTERAAEMIEEAEDDDVEASRPARQNPAGKEPLAYWESQGEWDAKHAFELTEFNEWVPFKNFLADIYAPGRPDIDPARVHAVAKTMLADYRRELNDDDFEAEWVEANEDELAEMGHLPSEAYAAWTAGYNAGALPYVTQELERRARANER